MLCCPALPCRRPPSPDGDHELKHICYCLLPEGGSQGCSIHCLGLRAAPARGAALVFDIA